MKISGKQFKKPINQTLSPEQRKDFGVSKEMVLGSAICVAVLSFLIYLYRLHPLIALVAFVFIVGFVDERPNSVAERQRALKF